MLEEPHVRETTIFTIRLWHETLSNGETEWRGAVKQLVSGEVRYFREWSALARLLPRMLEDTRWREDLDNDEKGGDAAQADAPG